MIQRRSLFTLPKVAYVETGLPPAITPRALDFHYNKHQQTYVTNANKMVTGTPYESAPLESVVRDTASAKQHAGLHNQVSQIWNHSFFWECMTPAPAAPSEAVVDALTLHFGSVEKFQEKFSHNALAVFGSGWTWLIDNDGQLEITNTFNAGTPLTLGGKTTPLLTLDVWEHAYYVDHQNRRADFINAFWKVCDWGALEKRLKGIKRGTFD